MADTEEGHLCWQCSKFVNIFPEFMLSIQKLKKKKKKTDEDGIVRDIISNGNSEITEKDVINNIFEYAIENGYICKNSYKDHYTYKVNKEISQKEICNTCGEYIVVFDCEAFNVDSEIKYVDVATFNLLAQEIKEIKNFLLERSDQNIIEKSDILHTDVREESIQSEWAKLFKECVNKDKVINRLTENTTKIIKENDILKLEICELKDARAKQAKSINDDWQTVRGDYNQPKHFSCDIPLANSFAGMPMEELICTNEHSDDFVAIGDYSKHTNTVKSKDTTKVKSNEQLVNKSRIYVDAFPERNKLPIKNMLKDIPPASNSTNAEKKYYKSVIISDSIPKRIDMRRFNESIENCDVRKRAFPGATASELNFYVKAPLTEMKPDIMIICAGTNNLTKKDQTVQETAKEVIDIARTCQQDGVKKVFISSLVRRPNFQEKVNEINKLLKYHETTYNYTFIDNSNIYESNLWNDGVHLNDDGIWKLANNYIVYLNMFTCSERPLPFNSIWDWDD